MYLAIAKEYEPLLLLPIAFGDIMANFPNTGFETDGKAGCFIGFGIKYEIFPPLIFMGVGAMTDFGPLTANPEDGSSGRSCSDRRIRRSGRRYAPRLQCPGRSSIGIIGAGDGPTLLPDNQTGSTLLGCYRSCRLLLHVPGSVDSATDHETLHHQRTASDPHGQPSSCNPLRKGLVFPDRRCYRSFASAASSSS